MIPFLDLRTQFQSIRPEIESAITRVLDNNQYILGPEVAAFESEFARYCQCTFGVALNSGTSALHLALLAAGIGPGDEVITVPFTFVATTAAICYTGAKPVFVDIKPDSFTMDPEQIEAAITSKTKAILPVHLYGHPADMDPILEIARQRHLVVIEDAAQAHGAEYKGRRVGSIGDLGCFSFYPGKNLGAYGEGGIVVTNNAKFAEAVQMLRDWGQKQKYHHVLKGFNYRMEGLQGAILRVKLRYLEQWTEARRTNARLYQHALSASGLTLPREIGNVRHVYHVYAVRTSDREGLKRTLDNHGVQTGIHYPFAVHTLPAYSDLGYETGQFPISERAAAEELSLPMFAELSSDQIEEIGAVVEHRIPAASAQAVAV